MKNRISSGGFVPLRASGPLLAVALAAVGCSAPMDTEDWEDITAQKSAIVNGTPGTHPRVGFLRRGTNQFCTASLIAPQWLVTAAHCPNSDDAPTDINFRHFGQTYQVDYVLEHPTYEVDANGNPIRIDTALLHLSTPVPSIAAGVMAIGNQSLSSMVGQTVTCWGARGGIKSANFTITSLDTVSSVFKFTTGGSNPNTQPGDSGGPCYKDGALVGTVRASSIQASRSFRDWVLKVVNRPFNALSLFDEFDALSTGIIRQGESASFGSGLFRTGDVALRKKFLTVSVGLGYRAIIKSGLNFFYYDRGGATNYDPTQPIPIPTWSPSSLFLAVGPKPATPHINGNPDLGVVVRSDNGTQTLGVGIHDASEGDFPIVGNDAITNITVASGYEAVVCRDDKPNAGDCAVFGAGTFTLPTGLRKEVSLVAVIGFAARASRSGASQRFRPGFYEARFGDLNEVGNDRITQLEVAPGYRAVACYHDGKNRESGGNLGLCRAFLPGVWNVGSGLAGEVSLLAILPSGHGMDGIDFGDVVAYAGSGFSGNDLDLGPGIYDAAFHEFERPGDVGNDNIESLFLPSGARVVACEDSMQSSPNGTGSLGVCRYYAGSASSLASDLRNEISLLVVGQ